MCLTILGQKKKKIIKKKLAKDGLNTWSTYPSHSAERSVFGKIWFKNMIYQKRPQKTKVDHKLAPPDGLHTISAQVKQLFGSFLNTEAALAVLSSETVLQSTAQSWIPTSWSGTPTCLWRDMSLDGPIRGNRSGFLNQIAGPSIRLRTWDAHLATTLRAYWAM